MVFTVRPAARRASPAPSFLPFRVGIPEAITLCLYAGLLAWAIPFHEPWADEAQAWQIARTLPLRQMFHVLSFEGHPGLWYLLLWALSRLHVGYVGMHWVAAAIAFAGIAVLVGASPFPRWLKLLMPFTFYLGFQYAVVARSYVMVPPLLFLCAWYWPRKFDRPLLMAVWLGLLANVVLHAAVISGGLAVVYLIDLWLAHRKGGLAIDRRQSSAAAALLVALYAIAIWTAFPAKEATGAGLVVRPNPALTAWMNAQQSQLPRARPEPLDKKSLAWLSWKLEARLAGGLTLGLIEPFWLGCLVWAAVCWKLFRNRKLHYLIPAGFFVVFCADVYAWFWHSGLMLPCLIAILWMTWPARPTPVWQLPRWEQLPLAMLLAVVVVQIGWAEYAFAFDHARDYSPGAATAAFLAPYVASGAGIVEIGDDFLAVDVAPYFERQVFLNEPYSFYWWSSRNTAKLRYQQLLRGRPGIVVLEWRFRESSPPAAEIASIPAARQLTASGYQHTHTFCGGMVRPGRKFAEWDCELIYQP